MLGSSRRLPSSSSFSLSQLSTMVLTVLAFWPRVSLEMSRAICLLFTSTIRMIPARRTKMIKVTMMLSCLPIPIFMFLNTGPLLDVIEDEVRRVCRMKEQSF